MSNHCEWIIDAEWVFNADRPFECLRPATVKHRGHWMCEEHYDLVIWLSHRYPPENNNV